MVSKWWMARGLARFERIARFDGSHEPKLYDEYIEVLANADRIKFNAITHGLSKSARSAPIARSTATGLKKPQSVTGLRWDDRGREMFFLLRLAFWLGLVLVLLPREKTPESEKLPQVTVSDAVQAATAAVSDMSQFCKRQPQACHVGGEAATVIGERASEGARQIYQSITADKKSDADNKRTDADKRKSDADKKAPEHTGSIGGPGGPDPVATETASADTLTSDDLIPKWRVGP